jgi:hypothetical protein
MRNGLGSVWGANDTTTNGIRARVVRNGHVDVRAPNRAVTVGDLSAGSRAGFDPRPRGRGLGAVCSVLRESAGQTDLSGPQLRREPVHAELKEILLESTVRRLGRSEIVR